MRKAYSFRNSKRLWREAQKVIAGGSQATRTPDFAESPTYFARAKGCRMWDVDGNEFIDLLCSIGPMILGYDYKRVRDAVRAMLNEAYQSSMNHVIQLELAKLLIEIVPSAQRVRFLKTGTEATQAAARLARHITGRTLIARHGYHGWEDMWWYKMKGGVHKAAWEAIPPFDGRADGLAKLFKKTKGRFAAVILCPADTKPFTTENYQGIIDVAHKHGALVIFDEIKSGFRMSLGGAQELLGVMPDLTTVSKAIANGFPLAAVLGKAEYMDRMSETPTAGTFSVEALSLAAALATLQELKEKDVVAHLWKVGQRLIEGLNEICRVHGMEEPKAYADPVPSMIRFTWRPGTEDASDPVHRYFFSQCMRYGLYFSCWHVGFVGYSHKNRDIDAALEICDFVMGKTKRMAKRRTV